MTTTSRPLSTARTVSFKSAAEMIAVLGPQDAHLTIVEDYFDNISIRPKDLDLLISGPSVSVRSFSTNFVYSLVTVHRLQYKLSIV